MIRFAGLDVHKRVVEAAIIDDRGDILSRARFDCTREALEAFARRQLAKTDRVALEATTNTWGVVAVLKPFVAEVVVSNPLRTKAIAEAKVKTDKVDAVVLAQLLRCDFLPRVWEPDAPTQELRSLTARRTSLIGDRTAVKNRIQSVLHQRMIAPPFEGAALFGAKGIAWLRELDLDEVGRLAIDTDLAVFASIQAQIDRFDQVLATKAYADEMVKLLMTQPGVDVAVAQTLVAALGDVKRFRDGDHAASYIGLVPSTKQSADHCYHGPITKQGRGHARSMLVQAAQHVGGNPGPLGFFFRRLAKKKGRNVAVVATARKMVVIAWHMLTNREPYRYAQPQPTQAKLAALRVKATGQRRRGVRAKGLRPPPPGKTMRTVPSLEQLCDQEGLPAPKALATSEARMVKDRGLLGFLGKIHIMQQVTYNRRSKLTEAPDTNKEEKLPPS